MAAEDLIGRRVDSENFRGTIKWVGEIPSTNGIWYGIDWDNENRGKHNGSHNGIKYFVTRYEKSGSFVRPTKVNLGMTLEEGLKDKYQNDPSIEKEATTQLQRTINARFVEVVGMEKISQRQSQLDMLRTAVLDGWLINGVDDSNLSILLPNLRDLDVSNGLLSSWMDVSLIAKQLKQLKFLNVSGNLLNFPESPCDLVDSFQHISHLVINQMETYTWKEILTATSMFSNLVKVQMAHNKLKTLSPIPKHILEKVEHVDLGMNDFTDWLEICHLGTLPQLKSLNLNSCHLNQIEFPDCPLNEKTTLFPSLAHLMVAENPLDSWKSTGELDKLRSLSDLIITFDKDQLSAFLIEFTYARIKNLETLNRTRISRNEKRDNELFYLRSFSNEYYSNGGNENPQKEDLLKEFKEKHPTYLSLVKDHGAPTDERAQEASRNLKLKDLKLNLIITAPSVDGFESFTKTFLPSTRLSKIKMMLRKQLKINHSSVLTLSYSYSNDGKVVEIEMENDMKDLQYYSISSGETLILRW